MNSVMVMPQFKKSTERSSSRYVRAGVVKVNGGGSVCLTQIQLVNDNALFDADHPTPILPRIKIRVTEGVSLSALDLIKGGTEKEPPSPSKNFFHLLLN